ncbi:hypothetical protein [Streptomyces rishiriensis]|uniref:Uncharacterized protein n=1 Tax=Streptomyces rishiriensis TaxID=68264 RepID=A0ABU0NHK0_STRRH|nr:hypothetical protein [Streptomyces rishiriensis]MDQ0578566.1 hypothetical protein [Streptomyces rishiriensis]
MGTRPSAVATPVERTNRYTSLVALPDGIKAEQVTHTSGTARPPWRAEPRVPLTH